MSPIIYGGSSGGGSQPITRGKYGYSPQTIPPTEARFAKFGALGAGGTALLDLTAPTKPLIVTAGTYAISLTVGLDDDLAAGENYNAVLYADVDGGNNAAYVLGQVTATASVLAPQLPLALTWYLPAGAAIQVNIGNQSANPHDYSIVPTCIQRLS